MKKFALLFGTLFIGVSLAQNFMNPKAAELLEKAKVAHGGAAFESMKTYQEKSTMVLYQNGQPAAQIEMLTMLDFVNEKVRIEFNSDGTMPEQVSQFTPNEAWHWFNLSGTTKLPTLEAEKLRDGLYKGIFAVRFGAKNRTVANINGQVELFGGIKGESITVKTKGATTNLIFDSQGTLIGLKESDSISVLSNFRLIQGVKIPWMYKSYQNKQITATLQIHATQINPVFTDATFAKMKK